MFLFLRATSKTARSNFALINNLKRKKLKVGTAVSLISKLMAKKETICMFIKKQFAKLSFLLRILNIIKLLVAITAKKRLIHVTVNFFLNLKLSTLKH
jgi:hypothetical protein